MAEALKFIDRNTIVIFTSDNGSTHNVGGVNTEFFNSLGDLRGKKGSAYEGGIRVPCIVRWPGKVEPGSTTDAATYFPDWFPTLCDITDAKMPEDLHDGVNLTPLLTGGKLPKRQEPMIWEFHGYGGIIAIQIGKWKAIRRNLVKKQPTAWELYNLDKDRNETKNVASEHPEIVQRLEKEWLKTRTVSHKFHLRAIDNK